MMDPGLLISWAALWLTVSIKGTAVYVLAWLISVTVARQRPTWRSFIWMATLASFPGLALLEWTGANSGSAILSLVESVPSQYLFVGVHAYAVMSLVLLGLVVHSAVRLRLLRDYSTPLDVSLEPGDDPCAADEAGPSSLLQSVRLLKNGRLSSPTSFGIIRPVIVLPDPPAGTIYCRFIQAALIHELINVLRFDALWTLLARLIQCLFFPHPLVWSAFRHYCLAREQACDRWTVRTTGEISEYELHLLSISHNPALALPMAIDTPMDWTGPRAVRARITDLQNDERPESLSPWPTLVATIAWMFLLAAMASIPLEPIAADVGPQIHLRPMLMGVMGALLAGGVLGTIMLLGRGRRERLATPLEGLAARSRQTLAGCVQRLEREWGELQAILTCTAQRLEPLLLVFIVIAATVSFWWMAALGDAAQATPMPVTEARIHVFNWP